MSIKPVKRIIRKITHHHTITHFIFFICYIFKQQLNIFESRENLYFDRFQSKIENPQYLGANLSKIQTYNVYVV